MTRNQNAIVTESQAGQKPEHQSGDVPIAIVGMACLFPQADSPAGFWSNILEGRDSIREVPMTHWSASEYFDADPKAPDMTYSKRGAFLDPVDFAPLDFGIAPKNLEAIDTTQLLGLMVARDALADSGYGSAGKTFNRHRASVILGVTGTLEMVIPLGARLGHPIWRKSLADCGVDPETAEKVVGRIGEHYSAWQENSFPGLLGNVTAGRIANRLDLGGTNCVVDAACASSLGAVHLAQMELATGRSDMVVTGGFDTFNDIFMFMCFSKTPALSKTGHARPFDQSADGTSLGEGLGAVVLKRLSDAERDGDRIYAVIRGVGTSSDGIGQAVYAPKAEGQVRCLKTAYEVAGVDPATVELVEAHGTGTKVGDGIEVKALAEVYREFAKEGAGRWCAVGSVKSQIGHAKAAAGVAGLIKAALSLHNKVIPPTIKVENPAEEISVGDSPFYVPTQPRPWPNNPKHPRRAGVSAFGFGGSNFHAVLEEHGPKASEIGWCDDIDLWTLTGDTPDEILQMVEKAPESAKWSALQRLAAHGRTASASAKNKAWRLSVVLKRDQDWSKQRQSILDGLMASKSAPKKLVNSPDGWYLGQGPASGRLALVFTGQGAQKVGMLRDAACRFPLLAQTLDEADLAAGRPSGFLVSKIYPTHLWNDTSKAKAEAELTRTDVAQPALAALGFGLARVLGDFGVAPHALAGHSLGELTALAAAGRIMPKQIHKLVEIRGKAMSKAADSANARNGKGGMLAILAEESAWAGLLQAAPFAGQVTVANRNAPNQTVVAGSAALLDQLAKKLGDLKIRFKMLPVDSAFHSPWVQEASRELASALASVPWRTSPRAVYQNTTAKPYPDDPATASGLLSNQLACQVDFVGMVRQMEADGCTTFLEVGPDSRLAGLIRQSLARPEDSEVFAISEVAETTPSKGILDLARTLARLWAGGHGVALEKWQPAQTAIRVAPEKKTLTVPLSGANLRPNPAPMPVVVKPKAAPVVEPLKIEQKPEKLVLESTPAPELSKVLLANESKNTKIPSSPGSPKLTSSRFRLESTESPVKSVENRISPVSGSPELKESSRMTPFETKAGPVKAQQSPPANTLIALQKLMEQTAAVHAQFLATQRHAQETVRMLLGGGQIVQNTSEPQQTNGVHAFNGGNGQHSKPAPAPQSMPMTFAAVAPAAPAHVTEPVASTGMPIPSPSTVYTAPAPMVMAVEEAEEDVFAAPAAWTPPVAAPAPQPVAAPVAAAAPSGNVAPSALAVILLEIVSEKTGYPLEMLDLDQQLDADLGIDSIKRVEILSAIQERRSDLPHVRTDQFGALRRLRDVVELLDATAPAVAAAPAPQPVAVVPVAPVAPVAAAPAANTDALAAIIKEIISEKTGYPVEMLDLDLQLDTDLGIDSIKRVEILSSIQERMPNIPHIRTDQFGALVTLRDIIKALADLDPTPPDGSGGPGGHAGSAGSSSDRPAVREVSSSSVRTSRLAVKSMDESEPRASFTPPAGSQVWILGSESDFTAALADQWNSRGVQATVIRPDEVDRAEPPDRLLGLVLTTSNSYDHAAFGRVLRLVQKVSKPLRATAQESFGFVAAITLLDGRFGFETDPAESEDLAGWPTASLSGLVKTLAWEWSDVAARILDVDPRWAEWRSAEAAARVVDELLTDGPVERGLSDREPGVTVETVLEPLPRSGSADIESLRAIFAPGDLVVVTGGARGVTAEVAAAFAEAAQPTLLLLGRSAEPGPEAEGLAGCKTESELVGALARQNTAKRLPAQLVAEARRTLADREVRQNLERFRQFGAKVVYRAVDLQNGEAVGKALAEAARTIGPIRGVIHGAGVLADKRVEDLTADACAPVLETKVRGLLNVLQGVDPTSLRFVSLFSSITARVGRTGQAAYAAANEMLNKLAIHQSRLYPNCRWLSLGWGPWDGGMVTPALKKVFASEGVGLIPLVGGSWTLLELIGGTPSNASGVEILVLEGEGRPIIPSRKVPEQAPKPKGLNGRLEKPGRSPSARMVWEKPASLEEWPVLKHHVIDGSAVIPTALLTEWMVEAAMHVLPGLDLARVESMKVLKGVILRADGPAQLQAWVDEVIQSQDGQVTALVAIRGVKAGSDRVLDHARARVILSPESPQIQAPAWLGHQPKQVWPNPYQNLLFHGREFQALSGPVGYDETSFVGGLARGSQPAGWFKSPSRLHWVVDPLVLDVIMQGLCAWPKMTGTHFSLPMGFESLQWRSVPPEAYAQGGVALRLERRTAHEVRADAVVWDAAGHLIGRVDGIHGILDAHLAEAFLSNTISQASGC